MTVHHPKPVTLVIGTFVSYSEGDLSMNFRLQYNRLTGLKYLQYLAMCFLSPYYKVHLNKSIFLTFLSSIQGPCHQSTSWFL